MLYRLGIGGCERILDCPRPLLERCKLHVKLLLDAHCSIKLVLIVLILEILNKSLYKGFGKLLKCDALAILRIIELHDSLDLSRCQDLACLAKGRSEILRTNNSTVVSVKVFEKSLNHLPAK